MSDETAVYRPLPFGLVLKIEAPDQSDYKGETDWSTPTWEFTVMSPAGGATTYLSPQIMSDSVLGTEAPVYAVREAIHKAVNDALADLGYSIGEAMQEAIGRKRVFS